MNSVESELETHQTSINEIASSVSSALSRISTNESSISSLSSNKQDKLVSGTNIKTINGNSIVGSGNVTIEAGSRTLILDNLSNYISISSNTITILYDLLFVCYSTLGSVGYSSIYAGDYYFNGNEITFDGSGGSPIATSISGISITITSDKSISVKMRRLLSTTSKISTSTLMILPTNSRLSEGYYKVFVIN